MTMPASYFGIYQKGTTNRIQFNPISQKVYVNGVSKYLQHTYDDSKMIGITIKTEKTNN